MREDAYIKESFGYHAEEMEQYDSVLFDELRERRNANKRHKVGIEEESLTYEVKEAEDKERGATENSSNLQQPMLITDARPGDKEEDEYTTNLPSLLRIGFRVGEEPIQFKKMLKERQEEADRLTEEKEANEGVDENGLPENKALRRRRRKAPPLSGRPISR